MLPSLLPAAVVLSVLAVGCTVAMLLILRAGPRLYALAALWFLAVGVLAVHDFFATFSAVPPRLPFVLLLPLVFLAVANLGFRKLSETLNAAPLTWLIYLQTFRVVVEFVLWRGHALGAIPVQMTFEGRNFDILTGLTAPIAAWLVGRTKSAALGVTWNLAGLVLVINVAVIAMLSTPTPLRMFWSEPALMLVAHFPFIYLPAVLVPIAISAHVLSIRQLLAKRAA